MHLLRLLLLICLLPPSTAALMAQQALDQRVTTARGTVHFRSVDVKDGLADNFVRDITTDADGYVWIATINGLSRYDGYHFLNFLPQQWGARSGDVTMVRQTADDTLWLLCSGELMTYRPDSRTWVKDGAERLSRMGIEGDVKRFYVDDGGLLWVATESRLYCHSYAEHRTIGYDMTGIGNVLHIVARNGTTLVVTTDYYIYKVMASGGLALLTRYPQPELSDRDSRAMIDSRMNLWLYHAHEQADALWVYSLGSGEWTQPEALRLMCDDVSASSRRAVTVNALAEDADRRLWVGTGNHGIIICEVNDTLSARHSSLHQAFSPHITCLYADRNNTMWVGSAKLGAAFADLNCPEFVHVAIEGHDDVSALMQDAQGALWIGLDGGGVVRKGDGDAADIVRYTMKNSGLTSDNITALANDGTQGILVGTYGGGIARCDGETFTPIYADEDRLRYVKALATDRHGTLWVGTVDRGVVRIDTAANARRDVAASSRRDDEGFAYYTADSSPLRSDGIICLAYDAPADRMYIGTSIGLAAYDCSRGCFIDDEALERLKDVYMTSLLIDNGGRLWIGSRNGLWVKGRQLIHLTTEQGLTNNVVRALALSPATAYGHQQQGGGCNTVWASTDNGLTSVTVQDDGYRCRPFFDSDGLHGISFSNNAALTTHEGTVLLGSLTGYISIPPSNHLQQGEASGGRKPAADTSPMAGRREGGRALSVSFTEFRINGQTVVMSPQHFTIAYGERLGVSISVMVPALSHKARYLYRFKGEDEWMRAPNNMLYFASLMPGTHVLQVKAELPGVATTEVSELTFRVLPPLWLSKGAIACYVLLLVAVVWLIWRAVRHRQKRELAMKQMELNLRKYEIEEQRNSFLTNISHDIKTPLTMVMAPLEKIRNASLPAMVRTEIDVAWQNARQLYDFVLELLDFRRLNEGKEELKLSHGELVSFISQIVKGFDYIAKRKNITIELDLPTTPVEMLFDEKKMHRILINLLSNACKYNVEGGSVVVTLKPPLPSPSGTVGEATISVADTGIGIKDKQHIFDRFVQETHGQEQEGSGLGLHIVRQYIDMMGGSITVEDNHPQGAIFTMTLPISGELRMKSEELPAGTPSAEGVATANSSLFTPHSSFPTILVVEDNTDARLFLQRSLEDEYHVLLAANGKEALGQLAKTDGVSIIVSDVMMPVMDGMELVRQIRKNIRYSHIPVILLTAKSSEEDIIAGLKEGVADYLTKPFSLAVLRLRIKKILEWTQHVHEQVATGIEIKPSEMTVSSLDEELISRVIAEVEANISNPTYSVVQLSAAIGMTRGTLYKKLMAIVGKSPVEFIRIVRLKRGKDLLDQGRTNIAEVADKVGFSPKMFAQYFREMYGETPSEYLKRQKSTKRSSAIGV